MEGKNKNSQLSKILLFIIGLALALFHIYTSYFGALPFVEIQWNYVWSGNYTGNNSVDSASFFYMEDSWSSNAYNSYFMYSLCTFWT